MATYILRSKKQVGTVKLVGNYDADRVLEIMKQKEPEASWIECEKLPKGKHACKYCGSITDGTHDDLLCEVCRETFGHALFSEL